MPAASVKGTVLLGDSHVEGLLDSDSAGSAEAFPFTAQSSGKAQRISVFVDAQNKAKRLLVGLYSSGQEQPGTRLASATVSSPQAGAWNTVSLPTTAVTGGKTYWVTLLGQNGTFYFRDRAGGPCTSQNSSQSSLTALPASWSQGTKWATCPVSAVVAGSEDTATVASAPTTTTATTTTAATTTPAAPSLPSLPVPPVNLTAPQISGTTMDGQTLNTSNGTWLPSPDTYSYQWQDCNTSGASCSNIGGATAATYQLKDADVGHTIRVVVTGIDAGGSGNGTSAATSTVAAPPAPTSTGLPQVSGAAQQGGTVTTTKGSWSGTINGYAYKWEDCNTSGSGCSIISGATSASYTLGSGDVGHTIRAIVTATNAGGSTSATSAATSTVTPAAPFNTVLPQISGTTQQGNALSTSNGTWTGSPTGYAYKWEDCNSSGSGCSVISGATSTSYTLGSGDVGHTIRAIVTATNAGGSTSATSAATVTVASTTPSAPANTAAPTVSGTTTQGNALTTSDGSWTNNPSSFTYQWKDCDSSGANCTTISGATSNSYTLGAGDVGDTIRSVVTATNAGGSSSATSAATAVVAGSGGGGGGGGTGGLPSGVTLQDIDGGLNYFGQWSNGFPTSSSFFPIGVFNQSLGYNSSNGTFDQSQITAYKNEGINTFVNLYSGYNQSLVNAIHAAGMYALAGPKPPSYANGTIDAGVWFDEADGGNDCSEVPSASVLGETVPCQATSSGRTPSTAIAQVNADLQGAKGAGDPTRPVYCQYTKPVAEFSGLSTSQASAYVNAGCGIVSYDSYIINDSYATPNNSLWRQYDDVENVRGLANDKLPVWPFLEAGEPFTSNQWSGITATPAMSVAEAWNSIIAGARGIQWFDHDFGGSSGGYAESGDDLIDSNSVFAGLQAAVKSFDNEVTALAPVLNSSFANGYVTNNGSMNVMVKYDATDNDFYIFAAPRSNSSQSITFNVAGGYSGPVQVYNESRTVTASNGSFTDTFSGQTAVHIYVVPNNG